MSHGSFYHYFDSKEQIFREVAEAQEAVLTAPDDGDPPAPDATEFDRILRANRRYFDRYRANGRIMGVIEEVSRYDTFVNEARMQRQKHFAERAEASVRRLQAQGLADLDIDPEIAAVALGAMIARFAELWIVEDWADYPFDHATDQVTRLWANAIGLPTDTVDPKEEPGTRRGRAARSPESSLAGSGQRDLEYVERVLPSDLLHRGIGEADQRFGHEVGWFPCAFGMGPVRSEQEPVGAHVGEQARPRRPPRTA